MELTTISEISRALGLSTRTLRYYEQIGLIESEKKPDYAYRVYNAETVRRLGQIIVLRKLRIPLKQIAFILKSDSAAEIIDAFQQTLDEVDEELTALSTIREIIAGFIARLNESIAANGEAIRLELTDDPSLLEACDALVTRKPRINADKDEKTASDLQAASETLGKLTDRDVKIVYLPSATVASIHLIGDRPEDRASALLRDFVRDTGLAALNPGFRHYGFNHPNGTCEDDHGYEYWVTIPDEFEVKPPFTKKRFQGGLYAAHTITFGEFEAWHWLWQWVQNSPDFEMNAGDSECMDGLLEEHFNYFNQYGLKNFDGDKFKMDLLLPIK